jgi:dipeptidyl aminopeptidase/acylaminoacyl peptidase
MTLRTLRNEESAMSKSVFDVYKNFAQLVRDASLVPAWLPDGSAFAFISGPANNREAWRVDLGSGKKTALFDLPRLREAIATATGVTPPGQGVPFEHLAFVGPQAISFAVGTDRLTLDLASYGAVKLPAPSALETYMGWSAEARMTPKAFKRSQPLIDPTDAYEILSPNAAYLLSIQDRNVALRATYDGRTVKLTGDGTPEVEWTVDWSNPMLAMMGLFVPVTNWSPKSNKLAAYKIDNRGVSQSPQVHHLKRADEVVYRYHGKAGGTLEKYTLYVLDVAGQPPVEIQLGDVRDSYPVFAGWLPDASELLVFQMSRDCRRAEVFAADPSTGAVRKLFAEEGKSFIRIHHDIYFGRKLGLTLTPDGQYILWLSERDGWKHIYQYDLQGRLVAQLTSGAWAVGDVKQVSDGYVYFTAHSNPARPYDLHLCRVALGGGKLEQLTEAEGKHNVIIAPDAKSFIDSHSAPARAPVTELRRIDGKVLNPEVLKADISKLEAIGFAAPEEFCVKAADGTTDLWGVMYKPHDFDPRRKYPVIEYIYGAPQIAVVDHGFASSFGVVAQRLAQLGCICVMLDSRGTPERSKAFHDTCYGNFAANLAADHAGAIRQLAQRYSFIDVGRVGIAGGSWGGYSSFRCLAEQPGVYKAAVCSAPGFDPYSSVLYECYLGLPQHNPVGYQGADALTLAARVQGEVMIAVGTSDHGSWTDAVKMSEALIRAGKQHEFVVLPEQYHGFDSVHEDYLNAKLTAFFKRHLSF